MLLLPKHEISAISGFSQAAIATSPLLPGPDEQISELCEPIAALEPLTTPKQTIHATKLSDEALSLNNITLVGDSSDPLGAQDTLDDMPPVAPTLSSTRSARSTESVTAAPRRISQGSGSKWWPKLKEAVVESHGHLDAFLSPPTSLRLASEKSFRVNQGTKHCRRASSSNFATNTGFVGPKDADGRPHGTGTMNYKGGASYFGEFLEGNRHGSGKFLYSDSSSYEGAYVNDQRHGQGVVRYPNGTSFDGDFSAGERTGRGEFSYADKGKLSVTFNYGEFEGFATHTFGNGNVYEGYYLNGRRHGFGYFTFAASGIRFEGEFKDGVFVSGVKFPSRIVERRQESGEKHKVKVER